MKIHRLNDAGIEKMAAFLDSLETNNPFPYPSEIIDQPEYAEPVIDGADLSQKVFGSRMEMTDYLYKTGRIANLPNIERDRGLWSWLAIYYFEQLCPLDENGKRVPRERARWIPQLDNSFRYYRHLMAGPFLIYLAHRDNPERASVLLSGPVNKPGELLGQFASRMEFVTNPIVLDVASFLYVDTVSNKLKRGVGSKTNGGARRLADILMQFDVTWDLRTVTAKQLLSMLPSEFNKFKSSPVTRQTGKN